MPSRPLEEMVAEIAAEHVWTPMEVMLMACDFVESKQLESEFLGWLVNEADKQDAQLAQNEQAAGEIYEDSDIDIYHDGLVYYPLSDDGGPTYETDGD